METFKRMIPNGYHDNFKFDEDLLNDYELDDLFSNYRRSYINENITKSIDKKDALAVAKNISAQIPLSLSLREYSERTASV